MSTEMLQSLTHTIKVNSLKQSTGSFSVRSTSSSVRGLNATDSRSAIRCRTSM